MSVPHKHAEVIKAWADGIAVEERRMSNGEWGDWKTVSSPSPTWWCDSCYEFRIKPKPDVIVYTHTQRRSHYSAEVYITCDKNWNEDNSPSFTSPCNLVLVFDGETSQLKDAKVIK